MELRLHIENSRLFPGMATAEGRKKRIVLKHFKDGYLTVYFSLIMAIFLSLLLALIEGARYSTVQFEAACAADIGLNSTFAEYHRELLDQYNLFAIDSSYLTEYAGKANTERHLREYIDRNLSQNDIFLANFFYRDFLGMKAERVEITGVTALSDEKGKVFRQCAVNAIKDDVGITLLDELKDWLKEVELKELDSKDLEAEKKEIDEEIEKKIREIREYDRKEQEKNRKEGKIEDFDEYEDYESPTAFLDRVRREGILKLIIPDRTNLSEKKLNGDVLIEKRIQQDRISVGNMNISENTSLQDMEERFFFQEYLLKYMGHFGSEKEKGALSYQLEYLVGGEEHDVENLRITANRICLIREAANVLYLHSNEKLSSQADVLASVIAFLTGTPEVKDMIKESIILGWAYAESIYDAKVLFKGGKIPLLKDDASWHYSLSNALSLWSSDEKSDAGMSYEDYLRVILMLENSEKLTLRAMDMVEADIRKTKGNEFFRLDACYSALRTEISIGSYFGYSFQMTREKRYESD